jgi:hypothetical protein
VPKQTQLVPKRLVYFIYEGILNTRGGHAFFMGAENAKNEQQQLLQRRIIFFSKE